MSKQYLIKTFLCIAMIAIVGFDVLFAQGQIQTTADQDTANLTLSVNLFLNILSWSRIIFANIAGSLLTNTWVYGEAIGFDVALWSCRNIIKNISNFLLGFVFLFYLFKTLFGQAEASSVIKNIVVKILVAGVAIQSSRFLVAATLDVSTIAVSAVGAFPAQLTANTPALKQGIKDSELFQQLKGNINSASKYNHKIVRNLFPNDTYTQEKRAVPMTSSLTEENIFDLLQPTTDSLAGPLVFMGISILETNGVSTVDYTKPIASLIKIIFEGLGIILYSLALIFLSIIAFLRILYLRLFVILSPLIILLFCLTNIGKNDAMKEIESIGKTLKEKGFDVTGFVKLAFKPVIVTLGISMAFIISVLMKYTITLSEQSFTIAGTTIESVKEETAPGKSQTYRTSVDNGIFQVVITGINKTFGQLLLSFVTLVMMGFVLKIAITSGSGIKSIDKFTEDNVKRVQRLAGNLPVIPIGGGISLRSIYNDRGTGLINNIQNKATSELNDMETKRQNALNKLLGFENPTLTASDLGKLDKTLAPGANRLDFINESLDLNKPGDDGKRKEIGPAVSDWAQRFEKWMNTNFEGNEPTDNNNARKKLKEIREKNSKDKQNLKNLLETGGAQYFRKLFGNTKNAPDDLLSKKTLTD